MTAELSLEDLPSHNAPHGKQGEAPHAAQHAANTVIAKGARARAEGRSRIIHIAILGGLVLAAGWSYHVWSEITPPPLQQHTPAASQASAATPAAAVAQATSAVATASSAPTKRVPAQSKPATTRAHITRNDRAPEVAMPPTADGTPDKAAQPIQIKRTQESDAVDPTLLAAWQAYRNGDFDTARQHYGEVLRKDGQNRNAPNRDALLGMAAIARQQSQDDIAAGYYSQVLMLDPRDPVAHAGMSALLGTGDAGATESRLKLLLAQRPLSAGAQSSALYVALGNLYAGQARWGDAQQAYLHAYNLEQDNAQSAFNLAVSLDHMGHGKLAAQHYQRALQLDVADNSGFNRAQTQQRINVLTAP